MEVRDRTSCFRALTHLIGNTPLLAIGCRFRGRNRVIYVKAEYLNFTGSIKDRMALHILRHAEARGLLRPGAPIAANFLGALLAQEKLDHTATVVTIFCDDNKKYLSTDLMREEPLKKGFLGPEVELLGFECMQRAFARGWDPFGT